ncbi:MAG TPA: septum formation initiator family protein [Candidatus Limnocylindrales bacterium]|nr:septum formation initiator family protein [Candidatus Limnocylindrales bacterium]
MDDRRALPPTDPPEPHHPSDEAATPPGDAPDPTAGDGIDLSSLSIAGITRRRVGWVAAALVAAWVVVIFARQASEGATAAARADQVALENAALAAEVAALEHELKLIQRPAYVSQQARAYRMGNSNEIPFTLDPSVPSPGPDAPGSASARVGADEERVTPLESWLSLLFGPAD